MTLKNTANEFNLFYEISQLNRPTIIKSCQQVGSSEEEFIKEYLNTTKFAWQHLFYHLFKLRDLKEFKQLTIVFVIGLILIIIFIK